MLAITDSWNSVHNYALKQQGVSKGRHFIQPIRQDQSQGQRGIVNSRPSKRIIRQRTRPRSRIWMLVLTIRAKAMQGLACVVLFWFTFKWCSYCYFTLLFSTHSVTLENLSHRNSFFRHCDVIGATKMDYSATQYTTAHHSIVLVGLYSWLT